jgi:hypothetical protein
MYVSFTMIFKREFESYKVILKKLNSNDRIAGGFGPVLFKVMPDEMALIWGSLAVMLSYVEVHKVREKNANLICIIHRMFHLLLSFVCLSQRGFCNV